CRRKNMNQKHRSGFVTLVGRPNVGKSTLLNNIIGQKVSIISDKIQTTRTLVQGILSDEDSQIIFIDTPGIHKPKHRLGDYMVDVSLQTLADVDIVLFMVNATEGYGKGDQFILDKLNKIDKPIFLIINKVDQIHPDALFPIIEQYKDTCKFEEIIPISALNGNNVDKLLELLKEHLIVGPKYFDENQVTDKTDRFIISELIREKVLTYTEEEVPHSINVLIEDVTRNDQDKLQIQASIIVERESQKGILIGKKGSMLKRIGQSARRDIEQFLDEKIFLDLWIKVKKDWRNKPSLLTQYGFYLDE